MKAEFRYPLEFYAACSGEASARLRSSSGGIVPALGRYVIERGGIVYGVRWNKDFRAVYGSAETVAELESFRGSKYVQSYIPPEVHDEIVAMVKSGRLVMFAGLPCQVAGILARLDRDFDNFISVDLICHGVPPESAFASELKWHRRLVRKCDDIRFRGNDGHNYRLSFWKDGQCLHSRRAYTQPYFGAFLASVNLKDACYRCSFARPERIADFSVGDYIVELPRSVAERLPSTGHISALCVNTAKAAAVLKDISAAELQLEPRPYEERLAYGPSLRHAAVPGRERTAYRRLMRIFPPAVAARLAFWRRWISVSIVSVKTMKNTFFLLLAAMTLLGGCRAKNSCQEETPFPNTSVEVSYEAFAGTQPLIGISATDIENGTKAGNSYVNAILASGGIPVVLPRTADADKLYGMVAGLDGLLLTGGDDIDPKHYREKLSPLAEDIDELRDEHELALARLAWEYNMPTLGICRGLQLVNVAFGGSLYQDIPSEYADHSVKHRRAQSGERAPRHGVKTLEGSTYAALVGARIDSVYSSHHQGIRNLAGAFRAVGWSSDGMVEAIEAYPYHPFMAVQYHPEQTISDSASIKLFRHFTAKAAAYRQAKEIHKAILSVDTHTDTPIEIRRGSSLGRPVGNGQVGIEMMQEGFLDSQFLAVWLAQGPNDASSLRKAVDRTDAIIDAIYKDVAKYPETCGIALGTDDLRRLKAEGRKAFFIGIENGYGIGDDLSNIERFYNRGVRYITLCHSHDNLICHSSGKNDDGGSGLTDFGREVIKEMNRVGMLIDLSHADDRTIHDVLELSEAPVVCTHSSARALCSHRRNLSDDMLRAIAEKGGVVQVSLVDNFTRSDYRNASVIDVVNHIEHVIEVAGIDHVGIGSDFDGGGGVLGCKSDNDMINITMELLARGHSGDDIRKIWGGNFFRVMDSVCNRL